jgi:hypothetical protein
MQTSCQGFDPNHPGGPPERAFWPGTTCIEGVDNDGLIDGADPGGQRVR